MRGSHGSEKNGPEIPLQYCGNEVIVTKVGGGTLVCCGQEMEQIGGE